MSTINTPLLFIHRVWMNFKITILTYFYHFTLKGYFFEKFNVKEWCTLCSKYCLTWKILFLTAHKKINIKTSKYEKVNKWSHLTNGNFFLAKTIIVKSNPKKQMTKSPSDALNLILSETTISFKDFMAPWLCWNASWKP